jgi:hypothetical protein
MGEPKTKIKKKKKKIRSKILILIFFRKAWGLGAIDPKALPSYALAWKAKLYPSGPKKCLST